MKHTKTKEMKELSKKSKVLHTLLIVMALLVIAATVWYLADTRQSVNGPTDDQPATQNEIPEQGLDAEAAQWTRVLSGNDAFSVRIPGGWGPVVRTADKDWLLIAGDKQKTIDQNAEAEVTEIATHGSDTRSLLTILIRSESVEPEGEATDFKAGELVGKKYTRVLEEDTPRGLGQRNAGDTTYVYEFPIKGDQWMVAIYDVYTDSDSTDNVETVDKIVRSLRLQ